MGTELSCERVLVLEDGDDLASTLVDVLETEGADVRAATTVEQAVRSLDEGFRPDVFLVDLRLGRGQRGDAFARRLRSDPGYAEVPVVLMSGDVQGLRQAAGEADATLVKPFAIEQLFEVLSRACDTKKPQSAA